MLHFILALVTMVSLPNPKKRNKISIKRNRAKSELNSSYGVTSILNESKSKIFVFYCKPLTSQSMSLKLK